MTLSSVILEKVGEAYRSRSRVVVKGNPLYDFNSIFSGEISSEGIKINILFKDFQNKGEITAFLNDCESKFSKGYTAFSLKDDFGVSNDYRVLKASGGVSKNNVVVYTFNVFPVNSTGLTIKDLISDENTDFIVKELSRVGIDTSNITCETLSWSNAGNFSMWLIFEGCSSVLSLSRFNEACSKAFPVGRVIGDSIVTHTSFDLNRTSGGILFHFSKAGEKSWTLLPKDVSSRIFAALSSVIDCCKLKSDMSSFVIRDYGGYADTFTYPSKESLFQYEYDTGKVLFYTEAYTNSAFRSLQTLQKSKIRLLDTLFPNLLELLTPYSIDRIGCSLIKTMPFDSGRGLITNESNNTLKLEI